MKQSNLTRLRVPEFDRKYVKKFAQMVTRQSKNEQVLAVPRPTAAASNLLPDLLTTHWNGYCPCVIVGVQPGFLFFWVSDRLSDCCREKRVGLNGRPRSIPGIFPLF
jgi:hypothetical protein